VRAGNVARKLLSRDLFSVVPVMRMRERTAAGGDAGSLKRIASQPMRLTTDG